MGRLADLIPERRVVTIEPTAALADAERKLDAEQVSHLMVVRGGHLVGVLCVCDIDRAPDGALVRDAMSTRTWTVEIESDACEASARMLEHGVSCLPVLRRGALCGVITLSDLAHAGLVPGAAVRCSACGSEDHVRCAVHGQSAGFCIECSRRSAPPDWSDDLGGSS